MPCFLLKIPGLLFEPVAIAMALGIGTASICKYRKNNPFYWIIACSLLFILLWRLCIHPLIVSSRYNSILLYPAAMFAVYGVFSVPELLRKNSWFREKQSNRFWVLLPWVLFGGLIAASLIKTLRYNPYARHPIKMSRALQKEIEGKKVQIFSTVEHERMAYYAKIERRNIQHFLRVGGLKEHLLYFRNSFKNIYFIFTKKNSEQEPDAAFLGVKPEFGSWECLHREYTSRRKNKEIVLYRFIPAHSNIEEWHDAIPQLPPDNLVIDGGFEKIREGKNLSNFQEYLTKIGHPFGKDSSRVFPAAWTIEFRKDKNQSSAKVELSSEKPLAGKYSLAVYAPPECYSAMFYNRAAELPPTDCRFQFFVRNDGTVPAQLTIEVRFWSYSEAKSTVEKTLFFWLASGKTYRIHAPIRKAELPDKKGSVFITISGPGQYKIDQFSITSSFVQTSKSNK